MHVLPHHDLLTGSTPPTGCLFPLASLPVDFLEDHNSCVSFFTECQMTSIQRNLDLYPDPTSRSTLEAEQNYCVECFFSKYDVKPLPGHRRMIRMPKVCWLEDQY